MRADGRKRLLWLIDSLTVGGAERLVATFAQRLDSDRFDLRVVCLKEIDGNPLAQDVDAAGIKITTLHARNLRDVRAFRKLLRFIREERIDVIHAHLTYSDLWGRLAGRLTGRPVVSTIHVLKNAAQATHRARAVEGVAEFVRKHFGGPIVAVSDALRGGLLARGLPAKRVVTLHNGIETSRFVLPPDFPGAARRAEFGIPADAPVAITLAVIRQGKGHDLLIDGARAVLERVPDAHFLVVGGGPLEESLRQRVESERLSEHVHLAGMRADSPEMLALADLFVLPSTQFDALPTAVIEAMASGLPVVAFASGGVSEIVQDGETGVIVPRPGADGLAEVVSELLTDRTRARTMGERGKARAEAEFSARVWASKLEKLYDEMTGERAPAAARTAKSSARPRVAVVEFFGRGGIVHYAYQLCSSLAAQGMQVELLTSLEYELDALPHNFAVRRIFRMWDPRPGGNVEWSSSITARLARITRRGMRAAMHYREWLRLILLIRRERPDIVQFGEIRFASDLAPLLALRAIGVRLADVCHNVAPFDTSADPSRITKESTFHRAAFRRIYGCFDAVFVHSEANRREFDRLYGGGKERIHVIPHGNEGMFIDPPRTAGGEALAERLGLEPGKPTALFFGTLTKYKGVDYLLDAFAEVRSQLPEAQLVIAGFPNEEIDTEELRRKAAQLGIAEAVKFHLQYVPVEEVADLFNAADVAVFPYLMIYQSGALQVAHSFGKPAVATDVGGLSEAVIDGETGLLVPPRDAHLLAEAIAALLSDPEKARRMGQRARELSENAHSWERIARKVDRVYGRLAKVYAPASSGIHVR